MREVRQPLRQFSIDNKVIEKVVLKIKVLEAVVPDRNTTRKGQIGTPEEFDEAKNEEGNESTQS